jgi:flagellar protein FlaF
MNTSTLARDAYAGTSAIAPLPRETEYRAFANVTRRITEHSGKPTAFPQLAEAVFLNQRLWITLAADVAGTENALTPELRAQIFYLSEFTRTHSAKVLNDGASPEILVEINTAIMRGLRPAPGARE